MAKKARKTLSSDNFYTAYKHGEQSDMKDLSMIAYFNVHKLYID